MICEEDKCYIYKFIIERLNCYGAHDRTDMWSIWRLTFLWNLVNEWWM